MKMPEQLAILGGGNIGTAIARGLVSSGLFSPGQIIITRRKTHLLDSFAREGFVVLADNRDAVRRAEAVIVAVLPQQVAGVLREIRDDLASEKHTLMSVVTGVSINEIYGHIGKKGVPVVRVMPNTAIAIRESMTCLAANEGSEEALALAKELFDCMGKTLTIDEEQMIAATALGACGVAFFLRAIRAASQGGIEIGFHPAEALAIAAQTAAGAAALLADPEQHPEGEIDKVTSPMGCTIAGLNEMEHHGFSSSIIRGITTSSEKAAKLYGGGG